MKNPSRIIPLFLLLATTSASSLAQQKGGQIRGLITDAETKGPLPLVNVTIEKSPWGSTTDLEGKFVISSIPMGEYVLVARLVGYEEVKETVSVQQGKETRITVAMEQTTIRLGEVRVTGDRVRPQDDTRTSVLILEPAQARTLAGVGEDVFRTLQALPGVLAPNDFSSQLAIRGSGPDQNLIIMDGIEVFNPYRLYGTISMFNPETVNNIELVTGGFGAQYGDRLSAVLAVTNKEGRNEEGVHGSVNASITNANIVFDGSYPFGLRGSYVVAVRRTYYDLILGPIAKKAKLVSGDVAFPNFADFQSKFTFEPSDGHKIILNGIASKDAVDVVSSSERENPDSVNVRDNTRNDVVGVAWHFVPSPSTMSRFAASWYRNTGDTEFGGDFVDPSLNRDLYENRIDTLGIRFLNLEFDSRYIFEKLSFKEEFSYHHGMHSFVSGAGVDFLNTTLRWTFRPDAALRAVLESRNIPFLLELDQTKRYYRTHLFVQDDIEFSSQVSVQAGLRYDFYDIIGRGYLQPRISASFALDPTTTLRAALGLYRQSPGYEKLLDQNSFIDLTNSNVGVLGAEKATHYVLGFDRWLDNKWRLQFETYYKNFQDVIVQDIVPGSVYQSSPISGGDVRKISGWTLPAAIPSDSTTTNPVNGAKGSSYGIEILLEKKNLFADDRLSGWVSYSLAQAERTRGALVTPFRFDQRHTMNLVIDYAISDWLTVGIRWKYGSGLPYTEPVGIRPRIIANESNGQTVHEIQSDGNGNVVFDFDRGGEANRFQSSLPPYHRLDARLTAAADYWNLDWHFYIDVINVYNRSNVLTYNYFIGSDLSIGRTSVYMLPLLPTLGFSVQF